MSFFDQPYYALMKAHMSGIGIWPDQSKYVRIIRPLTLFAITMTLVVPGLIRVHATWRNINNLISFLTHILIGIAIFVTVLSCIQNLDKIKLSLKNIETHWEMFKNTSAVIVLDEYAERGRYITVVYSIFTYTAMTLYLSLCLSPIIFDFVDPLNETRPRIYIIEAEYGVDADKYYWFILAHTYIVMAVAIIMVVAVETMCILGIVHACALFEVVGFNLKLVASEYAANKKNAITLRSDWNYKQMCHCITIHTEAISFADLFESGASGPAGVMLGLVAIITVISGVQALINWNHPEVLIQQVTLIIGQILHLYIISISGQELMNHSEKIHTTAYHLNWEDMSVNAQKLLILILMRSNKPCYFTAGKFYVLSLATFGSAIRTVMSYFTIFAQMI